MVFGSASGATAVLQEEKEFLDAMDVLVAP